ncbi:Carbamoyl-phosphate synthase arginine-specific large chain [Lachnellula occidentalis]|uniref:Carbamoyl phosphate synthase arginine-specific large chain, mitochondrial n=1 Tax=Lachnellula occidentalis TaxID=215460 RepID=A0A8H8S743_9HELO|nr:Carbamoyl-phosphate synthase arginine-specific large chain [Lachnellula occidentalis]
MALSIRLASRSSNFLRQLRVPAATPARTFTTRSSTRCLYAQNPVSAGKTARYVRLFSSSMIRRNETQTAPNAKAYLESGVLKGAANPVDVKKVLVIGSGGLSIGQAGEFDYSGSQALKALKEAGVSSVLINPNIATIQTAHVLTDEVYYLPVTPEYVTYVIERERPDGIFLTFGGQTALNLGVQMERMGVFERYGVKVLGTSIKTLETSEDRDLFAKALAEINIPTAQSIAVSTVDEALVAAEGIGYPIIVRAAYALGGLGSGFANNEEELRNMSARSLTLSPQILVEKSLKGWKEVEYEVVRDASNNCITVCNMENFDPLGIHTGDSIVVAPSQTLSDEEYHMLRSAAIKIVRHLGVVGECNVQYALQPDGLDYRVIEVNARLSRSSALASKATGYPLAYTAAKIGLGHTLPELPNAVTKTTTANFEPSLDYVVTKIPRWDLAKFQHVKRDIGSAMKSVGEVMAIGRTFEESIQKAIRQVDPRFIGFQGDDFDDLDYELANPTDRRWLAVGQAMLHENYTVDRVHDLTKIDKWFLYKLQNIVDCTHELEDVGSLFGLKKELVMKAKKMGFSDRQIAKAVGSTEDEVRARRKGFGIKPFVKKIDTLAAEFPADTNYLVESLAFCLSLSIRANGVDRFSIPPTTPPRMMLLLMTTEVCTFPQHSFSYIYNWGGRFRCSRRSETFKSRARWMPSHHLPHPHHFLTGHADREPAALILGSGVYRIGSSVEFDWCAVSATMALKEMGKKTVMINYNPETYSTDFDTADKLYFEELSYERVMDIYELESATGVVVSVGGQLPQVGLFSSAVFQNSTFDYNYCANTMIKNIALRLQETGGAKILGTDPRDIDKAEDRQKFSEILDSIGVDQPAWKELTSVADAERFADEVSYPVLVRPSYVLSGAAMTVIRSKDELKDKLEAASNVSPDHPVVITKFIEGAEEIDVDAVGSNGKLIIHAVSEHVEQAGVHSGDATLVLPPASLDQTTMDRVKEIAVKVAKAWSITGPFNMQIIKADDPDGGLPALKVIECNLRASRSFPFVSKVLGVNFIDVATKALVGRNVPEPTDLMAIKRDYLATKVPQFSWTRLAGADPFLGVEMSSTGEIACFGKDLVEAYWASLQSTMNFRMPEPGEGLLFGGDITKESLTKIVDYLSPLGYKLYAAEPEVKKFLESSAKNNVSVEVIEFPTEDKRALREVFQKYDIRGVFNLAQARGKTILDVDYVMRRNAVDFGVPLFMEPKTAELFAQCMNVKLPRKEGIPGEVRRWSDFIGGKPL